MKTLLCSLSLLLCIATAKAQPHIVSISAPITEEGRTYVIATAQKLANKSCLVESSPTANFQQAIQIVAYLDCHPDAQTFDVYVAADIWPQLFIRARNDPCPNFAVVPVVEWEPPKFLLNPLNL